MLALAPIEEPRAWKAVCSGCAELENIVANVSGAERRGEQKGGAGQYKAR